jgi:hypothetical protein
MNQKPKEPRSAVAQDAFVEEAWFRLLQNKDDSIEGTFCYKLFELRIFDETLFQELCADMENVLRYFPTDIDRLKTLVWIISCTFRSVFSHYDDADLFMIENFDNNISARWGADYCDHFRELLDLIFSILTAKCSDQAQ